MEQNLRIFHILYISIKQIVNFQIHLFNLCLFFYCQNFNLLSHFYLKIIVHLFNFFLMDLSMHTYLHNTHNLIFRISKILQNFRLPQFERIILFFKDELNQLPLSKLYKCHLLLYIFNQSICLVNYE